jgi:hypothetical protein
MNKSGKIFLIVLLIIFAGRTGFAQVVYQQNDTLKVQVKRVESTGNNDDQNTKEVNNNQQDNGNNNAGSQSIKRLKSARPDMSKARGARPPNIVRPTGSRIPNGIGRPAGAVRPGHG